ncbi:MAG: ABC transporter substrate-binding protein, partial [Candidatus Paceibacterota bacterium]
MENDLAPKRRPLFDLLFSYLDERLPSDRMIIYALLIIFVSASSTGLLSLNKAHSTVVPSAGGVLVEGIIGSPRFVNPVLAITRTDSDLVALTYSGLLKLDENGTLVPDLAESMTVSDDGLVYNIVLRDDVQFHNGTPIRSDDVAYTIKLIQDSELKSPLRGNWSGVTVEVINERELNFILENAYSPFRENLTVGIMPKNIWDSLSNEELPFSQHNTEPIGSGPYTLTDVTRDDAGLINGYELRAFSDGRQAPKITTVMIK